LLVALLPTANCFTENPGGTFGSAAKADPVVTASQPAAHIAATVARNITVRTQLKAISSPSSWNADRAPVPARTSSLAGLGPRQVKIT
jgi:hypothetical protein